MTRKQRRRIWTWIAVCGGLAVIFALDVTGQESWIRPVLFVGLIGAAIFERPDRAGRERWERIVRKYPFIKLWLAICALSSTVVAVLATHYFSVRILDGISFSGLLALLLVVIGPVIAIGEYEKFREAGSEGDSI
jgi:hypothetical protein